MATREGGIPRLAPVGQDKLIELQTDLLEAQQDTNALLRDMISEIKTLRRVMENSNG